MQSLAADPLVHDYLNGLEFREHAEGRTDHLGNLSDGTWVRFSPTALNVVGENHIRTTLTDVVRAVGTRSFIYESFPTDDLSRNPATADAIKETVAERRAGLGVGENEELRKFGAESIFPKLGTVYLSMRPLLQPSGLFTLHGYFGKISLAALKIGWAYAGEVHQEVQHRKRQNPVARAVGKLSTRRNAEARVAETFARSRRAPEFIARLEPGEYLGARLESWDRENPDGLDPLFAELRQFADAMVVLMREKAGDDPALNFADRVGISRRRRRGGDKAAFAHWRDVNFREYVLRALQRGVRYAGMGAEHAAFLRDELKRVHDLNFYDLEGEELARDRRLTAAREAEMPRRAARVWR